MCIIALQRLNVQASFHIYFESVWFYERINYIIWQKSCAMFCKIENLSNLNKI